MAAKKLLADALAKPDNASFQVLLLPFSMNLARIDSQTAPFASECSQKGKQEVVLGPGVTRPVSVVSVLTTSSNPHDDPAINPVLLAHAAGVEILAKGLELCLKMTESSPFKEKINMIRMRVGI
jgi:hypothetical protein